MSKNILLIAYHFPPTNNGGVQRPASFEKFLPLYGYQAIVLTVRTREAMNTENNVIRIPDPGMELADCGGIKSFAFRAIRKVLLKTGILPGVSYWWYKEVKKYIPEIIQQHKPDLILATFPPLENLIIGMEVSKKYNIPLIADFRDGLCFEPLDSNPFPIRMRERKLEMDVVNQAAQIITVTDPITNYFNSHYPQCNAITITNGFDADEWIDIKKINLGDKINIAYTGRLSNSQKGRNIESFVSSFQGLNANEKQRIRLHMIGDFSRQEQKLITDLGNPELINFVGFVDRKTALQYQYSADLLLLVTAL